MINTFYELYIPVSLYNPSVELVERDSLEGSISKSNSESEQV